MRPVAVLFARRDSVYKRLAGCDVWDADRDARKFAGGMPVVAHPPCRAWGQLSHFAAPREDEKDLARFAVAMVRRWGGVLEHPARSLLWDDQNLPKGQAQDEHGGWTMRCKQSDWGHRAEKATNLYIVGCLPRDLPPPLSHIGGCALRCDVGRRRSSPARRPRIAETGRDFKGRARGDPAAVRAMACGTRPPN